MVYFPLIMLFLILLVLITRSFTTIFHELGHAIPAILLTKEKVTIYIGSHGDPAKSLRFKFGLLEVWFRYNPFSWQLGLCVPSAKQISVNRQIIYTLTGPITSFAIATFAFYFTFTLDLHGSIKLILVIFLGSSIFDLIINLVPRETPIHLYDGSLTYNDGYNLKRLFYHKKLSKEYAQAAKLYNQENYKEAALIFNKILNTEWQDENIYRIAIITNLQIKNYTKAKELLDVFITFDKMDSDDFANAGVTYSNLGLNDKAIEFYDISLQQNPNNKYSLNNKAFTLNLLNRYEEAIPLFDKALEIDKKFAYSYNNRGLSKIKIGKEAEGLEDINYSLTLDKDNSYGYCNLGIYHFDKHEFEEALKLFIKAKKLDDSTHLIDEWIKKAEQYKKKKGSS